jgi:hypothetical protein
MAASRTAHWSATLAVAVEAGATLAASVTVAGTRVEAGVAGGIVGEQAADIHARAMKTKLADRRALKRP